MESTAPDHDYWDAVGAEWRTRRPHRLWREFTDSHQLGLIGRGLVRPLLASGVRVTGIDISPVIVAEAAGGEAIKPALRSIGADGFLWRQERCRPWLIGCSSTGTRWGKCR